MVCMILKEAQVEAIHLNIKDPVKQERPYELSLGYIPLLK